MPLHPSWLDLALRFALAILAGTIMGLNREARGHAAGLRTTILVALAACIAMIQANLLLSIDGKNPTSFGVMDLMRLPLGILTGVGFIGGGTILKRGNLVTGITTAATLWVVTVIGLCFGGGQNWLGMAGTILAGSTLSALKWLDRQIPERLRAVATTRTKSADPPSAADLGPVLEPLGYEVRVLDISEDPQGSDTRRVQHEICWKQRKAAGLPQDLRHRLDSGFNLVSFRLASEDE